MSAPAIADGSPAVRRGAQPTGDGITLHRGRCAREFGTERIRDLCHGCQLAQQAVWPDTTHQRTGEASGC